MRLKKSRTNLKPKAKPTYAQQRAIALQIIERSAESLASAYLRQAKAQGFPPKLWLVKLPKERGLTDSEQAFLNQRIMNLALQKLEDRGFQPFAIVECE